MEGENPRRGFAPFEYTTHFQMWKSSILEFGAWGRIDTIDQNLLKTESDSCAVFFVAFFFIKPLNLKSFLCDLSADVRELVTTDTCEIKWKVRLNAELKASIGTTCAAVLLVAALLLSTYLLNDWPAHVLEKHAFQRYIWTPAPLSSPFAVRSVSYLCAKIFITLLKIERRCAWGERAANYSRAQCGTDGSITAFWLHMIQGSFCLRRNN